MKKKHFFQWIIFAAVTLVAGTLLSCSDDDDDKKNGSETQNVDGVEGMSELAEDQLRDLICQWCDVQKSELRGGSWQQQTFQPTVGVVNDESMPAVRTIAVGTLEKADQYAQECFSTLGIDGNAPDGFSFNDANVGKLSYSHSSDGNTLATINVDVRQMPQLQQIKLVKDWPTNAGGNPYYTTGDIIKVGGSLYVCVSEHNKNEKARFVTLNDRSNHSTGTFKWYGVGSDVVYNDDMASPETLALWLKNIVVDEERLKHVRNTLNEKGFNSEEVNQVVPATEDQRFMLLYEIQDIYHLIIDASQPQAAGKPFASGAHVAENFTWETLKENKDNELEAGFDPDAERNICHVLVAPVGFLLTKKPRWSMHLTGLWDQWLPYIFIVRNGGETGFADMKKSLDITPSQTTLSPSHFKWQELGTFILPHTLTSPKDITKPDVKADTYHVIMVAMYWQHEMVYMHNLNTCIIWDLTKDFRNHPLNNKPFYHEARYWYRQNITSTELTFTDGGKQRSKTENIYVKSQEFEIH
jgi:hypothetical protein